MESLKSFREFTRNLQWNAEKMPVLFMGHGSPMNGIEHNQFSETWASLGRTLPVPTAVLVVSAHWLTRGTRITAMDFPPTIHDFGGFPGALYEVQYPAPGSPDLARETVAAIHSTEVVEDHDWGLDHGAWTIIRNMYPEAKIPVLQMSIDFTKDGAYHYQLAKELAFLRKKGVLIIGSGNMVHNLRLLSFDRINEPFGFDWAAEMNETFKKDILERRHDELIAYEKIGPQAKLAIPTPDHYFPLLYTLGLQEEADQATLFNDSLLAGSLTMTSVLLH
ncbi:MAG: 4,5-DOPA dioxygenase extradiol [Bacteroidota bacterium]|nr:4,5-DOPA dioxygenase extradiol [Bacteroidota bacterium]